MTETNNSAVTYGLSLERLNPVPADSVGLVLSQNIAGQISQPTAEGLFTFYGATTGTYNIAASVPGGASQNICFQVYQPDGTVIPPAWTCTSIGYPAYVNSVSAKVTPTQPGTHMVLVAVSGQDGTQNFNLEVSCLIGTCSSGVNYAITGSITSSGIGLAGVTVALSGSQSSSVVTNSSGSYSFSGLAAGGNYTITPSLTGYAFIPSNQTFNNLSGNQTANFTATTVAGLVGWWRFDEPSGAIVNDSSGNGNAGTLSGGYARVPGWIGQAISLNGGAVTGVNPGTNFPTGASALTLTAWVKVSAPVGGSVSVFNYGTGPGAAFSVELFQHVVTIGLYGANGGGRVNGSRAVDDGAWHNIAAVYGGSGSNALQIYVDGTLDRAGSAAMATGAPPLWRIGQFLDGSGALQGVIDEVRFYNRALSAAEIQQVYSATAVTLTSSPNPSTLGQNVNLTATVSPATATGSVTFQDGTATLGTANLNNGAASLSVSTLSAGVHSLTAVYNGDSNYLSSTSAILTQTVNVSSANYTISGSITYSGGGLGGVTVALSGSQSSSVVTNSSGSYSFSGLAAGGNYTITPSFTGYAFTPSNQTFNNLSGNQTANFTAATAAGLEFYPVTPCRVVDTRTGAGFTGAFGPPSMGPPPASPRVFPIPSSNCGIPATASAYSLNVTVIPQGYLGYLSIWPTGQPQPGVSTLNSYLGTVVSNAAIVPAGAGGQISVYVTNPTDVAIDIDGYFAPPQSSGLEFYTLAPCRVVDTRQGGGKTGVFGPPTMMAATPRSFPIPTSPCGIPGTAGAYSFNFTVVPQGYLGYLTTWPTGQPEPNVSTLNSYLGTVVSNAAIVPAGNSAATSVYVTNTTDVIIDTNGYFASASSAGYKFYPVNPCRVADTRSGAGFSGFFGPPSMGAGTTRTFPVPSSACGIPATAAAYSLNTTVVPAGYLGYLTIWPAGQGQPGVSTLNSYLGTVVANAAIVPAGNNGAISIYVTDATDVLFDINGYFAP